VVKVLHYQSESPGIPGGVTGDFFPEVDSDPESEYQGFLLG